MERPTLNGDSPSIVAPGSSSVQVTEREHDIARLISMGFSHKKVGYQLGIKTGTVGHYVHEIAKRIPGNGSPSMKVAVWFLSIHNE